MRTRKVITISMTENDIEVLKICCGLTGFNRSELFRRLLQQCSLNKTLREIMIRCAYNEELDKARIEIATHNPQFDTMQIKHTLWAMAERRKTKFLEEEVERLKPHQDTWSEDVDSLIEAAGEILRHD